MIRHTVAFKLKHPPGSTQEKEFLEAGLLLAGIPTVKNFECLRQVEKKNSFTFGFSMEFNNQEDYQTYSEHKDHVDFVNNRWIPEVTDFSETDYTTCDLVEQ